MLLDEKKILVVGDVMLDIYDIGNVQRISPEAPVPVLRRDRRRTSLGGAANVAVNLVAAGQKASIVSLVGWDEAGEKVLGMLEELGISTSLVRRWNRPTVMKTRFMANNNQQILRLDVEDTHSIDDKEAEGLLDSLASAIKQFDLIVVSDYLKGLLTPKLMQGIIRIAKENALPVFVDVKDPQREKYAGATLLKPNQSELHNLTGMPVGSKDEVIEAAFQLCQACNCEYVLTTCGARGMVLVNTAGVSLFVPASDREVFDVTGAGDTAIAYLAACYANGLHIEEAMRIANEASGVQVAKVGTSAVYAFEVELALGEGSRRAARHTHVLSRDQLEAFRVQNADKKIVFTNGCFDILHAGHVQYLEEAAELGDFLIVGVNSDDSVRRLKGDGRPINVLEDRLSVLGALAAVDYLVAFDEDTPHGVISALKPDVLVKGGDYSIDEIVGHEIVQERGGSVVSLPFLSGRSSSAIICRIMQSEEKVR